jgi:signal transduction histidine kinase/ligand-binding sensor domain-containing protein/CheY-like chemotaxis protein/AraC-like DNA-binding protein
MALRKKILHIAVTLLSLLLPTCLQAVTAHLSTDYHFTHIKSAEGLPHLQVETMAIDSIGRVWIGTRNGLSCYDGYTFKNYYHTPDDANSLCHNFVNGLLVDSHNNLWVGTEKGVSRYCPENDSFYNYDFNGERISSIVETAEGDILVGGNSLRVYQPGATEFKVVPRQDTGYIVGMAVSADNRIYTATYNGISCYDSTLKQATFVDSSLYSDFLVGFDDITPLFFDRDDNLWIGRNGKGAMCVNLKSGERSIYDVPQLTNGTVRCITQDKVGNIWLGTEMGVNIINLTTGHIDRLQQDFTNHDKLNDNAIYCIVPDRDGNVWIGTYFGGINLLRSEYSRFHWIAPGYESNSLHGKAVRRIVEPLEGTMWLATEDGGINIMDMVSHRVTPFTGIAQLGVNVHELYFDKVNNRMWIGSFRNGLFRYDMRSGATRQYTAGTSGLDGDAIFCIVGQQRKDGSKRLWVGSTQGLRYYDAATDRFEAINAPMLHLEFIYCMMADRQNNLWVGTVNNGLFRIDADTDEVHGWNMTADSAAGGLRDSYVTALCETAGGDILVGTSNGGLHVLDRATQKITAVNAEINELGCICSIICDGNNRLWVSTSKGLFNFDSNMEHMRRFTMADGLPENQFNFASSLLASDGMLYFGTVNGLVAFDADIEKVQTRPRRVHLWNLLINNKAVAPETEGSPLNESIDFVQELHLSYEQSRTFTIEYGVVDPTSAASTVYQVYVSGVDKRWRDVGELRRFTALNFSPGSYKLMIRALNGGDNWEDAPVRELLIKIAPPFYLSTWAYCVYLLLAILMVLLLVRYAGLRIAEKNRMRLAQLDKEKSDELNREKMEFFTNISHELKTPLSLILAPLKYVSQHQELTADSAKRLDIAIANTSKMVGMIDELVTFNRVESGRFQLYLQKGNPLTFVETLSRYFYEMAREKRIEIHVYTENNGEEVWFSTNYLEIIFNNLLSNAVKYTSEGGEIYVRAKIEEEDNNNIYMCLEVRDTGIGIAPEELENIFQKYYQTKRGYNTNHQGWGIGLATVKRLAEIHKGDVTVESVVGAGSTFRVRLNVTGDAFDASCRITSGNASVEPAQINRYKLNDSDEPLQPLSTVSAEYALQSNKTTILLVEDNSELLTFLVEMFSANYNVLTATNGVEALKVAEAHPVDIVVSDVMMPEMDGVELCERLKNDLSTSHIPVILLTAKNDEASVVRGYKAGAEAYVAKPFDPQILELRVNNILRARSKFLRDIIDERATTATATAAADAAAPVEVEPVGSGESGETTPTFNTFDKEFIARINALVEANLSNSSFAISDITREFGISRSLLHIKMKSFFSTSMTDFVRKKRMEAACRLLKEGYNVSETAYRTGYADPNYFTKVFKKELGVTPTEFAAHGSLS